MGRLPQFTLCTLENGVFEIREFNVTRFYEWFGLRFTGAGLPSLARRARVPADSATLYGIVIILTFTYACLLLKVHGQVLLDSRFYISYWKRYVTEGFGDGKINLSLRSVTQGGWGRKSCLLALRIY